jgi:mono/diheme cytochrome c family protein
MKRLSTAFATLATVALSTPAFAADEKPKAVKKDPKTEKAVKRGEYIVSTSGCHDCHTPKTMTPQGPVPDMTRMLSGTPAEPKLPPAPKLPPGPWVVTASGDLTAWSGPWGTTFARNLTPDKATGLGDWTEQNFIDTIRTGKRLGKGRMILPPMPWEVVAKLTDEDLKAVFAYLQSIPAISNAVREPEPPPAAAPPPAAPPAAAPAKK